MNDLSTKAAQLGEQIRLLVDDTTKEVKKYNKQKEVVTENGWGASYFYTEILFHSKEQRNFYPGIARVRECATEFHKTKGIAIDVDQMLHKDWLRLIYGRVHLSAMIGSMVSEFDRIYSVQEEIKFLIALKDRFSAAGCTQAEFEAQRQNFEQQNEVILDFSKDYVSNQLKEKNGIYIIENVHYYKPIFDNFYEFQFLHHAFHYSSGTLNCENHLYINAEEFEVIHHTHKQLFPKTPNSGDLIGINVDVLEDDRYILDLGRSEQYRNVHDKVGALLWGRLLDDSSYDNDDERMLWWVKRCLHFEWCDTQSHFISQHLDRFLTVAISIVLDEPDLTKGQQELEKILLDQRDGNLFNHEHGSIKRSFPDANDLFTLYNNLVILDDDHHRNFLFEQLVRTSIAYFVRQIVLNDGTKTLTGSYPLISRLLDHGTTKPYLLWRTCEDICDHRQELIPMLFLNSQTASLGFSLLWEIRFDNNRIGEGDVFTDVVRSCFSFLIECTLGVPFEESVRARIYFQCLLIARMWQFKMPVGNNREVERLKRKELAGKLSSLFAEPHYDSIIRRRIKVYPAILDELFAFANQYSEFSVWDRNTLKLPFVKIDFCSYILSWQFNTGEDTNLRYEIGEGFLHEYLQVVNCTERIEQDTNARSRIPHWNPFLNDFCRDINWAPLLLILEQENLLRRFVHPSKLAMRKAKDKYDDFNRFTGEKIRTHLFVLLSAYSEIYEHAAEYKWLKLPVDSTLVSLENGIIDLIVEHSTDEPGKGRLDIFDSRFEGGYSDIEREELLPLIGATMNRFSAAGKRKLINGLILVNQLIRSLKLLNYAVSQQDRSNLIEAISSQNIRSALEDMSVREINFALQQLAMEEQFLAQAKDVLEFWEERIVSRNYDPRTDEYKIIAFRMKLLLAYHNGAEYELDRIEKPDIYGTYEARFFKANEEIDFYRALLYLKHNQPAKAYSIFRDLISLADDERPTLELNSFASKLQWADLEADKVTQSRLYAEALFEWNQFEQSLQDTRLLDDSKEKVWYNKLRALLHLQDTAQFDVIYQKLDLSLQLRSDFLELRVKQLVDRKINNQADELLQKAAQAHQLENGDYPEFINELRSLIETDESIKSLQEQFRRIISRSPEQLIRIIPGIINEHNDLPEALLSELLGAANDMLQCINSVAEIRKEDKYSDLLVMSLKSRLGIYSMQVGNSRGGYSDSDLLNPGELDFAISSRREIIAICEAMVIKGGNLRETQKHNYKIFNYGHARKLFYLLTYFTGKRERFEASWKTYKKDITTRVQYPPDFPLVEGQVIELDGNNAIKVARGVHGTGAILYHVFINIHYKI